MKYKKEPKTILEQIEILKGRGLKFEDEKRAENYLSNISYYRLRAYTHPFQDNNHYDQPFNVNVTFDQIIKLYVFDRKLRLLIFDAIEKIEVSLRTQLIYHNALTYGTHWNFNNQIFKNQEHFKDHIESLRKEIKRSPETFISHYTEKYSSPKDPPCWMSLEVSSMGLLSKIFENLNKSPEKIRISHHFGLNDTYLTASWMRNFSVLRNICAHHGRIWNRSITKIKLPTNTIHPFLKNRNIQQNKLYATLSCIQYVLREINPGSNFNSKLKDLIQNNPLVENKDMGFPNNWLEEELWK